MATATHVELNVLLDHAGYRTSVVRGARASCTYSAQVAVQNLAEKLFPVKDYTKTIERLPCTPVGCLHSKWRITPELIVLSALKHPEAG